MLNLLDFSLKDLEQYFISIDEPKFRAKQVIQWVHQKAVLDFDEMSNLSKSLRAKLKLAFELKFPKLLIKKKATDNTIKYLVQLEAGNCVEVVYIPETNRATLCVSSQVGCALNCTFCSTAQQGFNRNLTTAEIISQLFLVREDILAHHPELPNISNVVFMGMGEPLLNYDNVLNASSLMLEDFAYGLSKYRVTLSSSGVVPKLEMLKKDSPMALAISLHAPNDELRSELVPINKKYPLSQLLEVCRNYFEHSSSSKRKVTFEYVMLDGVNDSPKHARQLITMLQGIPAKINLIPFNPFPNTLYKCSSQDAIYKFHDILNKSGITTTIRKTRGDDIDAACGQLVGDFNDRTSRSRLSKQRYLKAKELIDSSQQQAG